MAYQNSFGVVRDLEFRGGSVKYYSLPALQHSGFPGVARLPYLAEDPAGEPAAPRGQCRGQARRHPGARQLGSLDRHREGDRLHPGAGAAAGLHGRAGRGGPRGHARRDGPPRRRSEPGEPASADGTRHRSLRAGGPFRHRRRVPSERGPGVRAQQGALHVPPLGAERVRQLPRRPARDRHRAPGEPRVPGARRLPRRAQRRGVGVPGHARGHRLAHDDGERPRRGRLGRGRDRGRGGDAGPAHLDADPAGGRLPPRRHAAGGHDRHRPRADRDRAAPQAWRRGQVRRVLRPRTRQPVAGRSRDAVEHVPRVRRHRRDLPDRRDDHRLPAPHRPRRGDGDARGGVCQGPGPVRRRGVAGRGLQRRD